MEIKEESAQVLILIYGLHLYDARGRWVQTPTTQLIDA